MIKPIPKQIKAPMLDYHDVIHFVEDKYKIETRDYANLFGKNGKVGHFGKYQEITGDKMPFGNGAYPDVSGKYQANWQEPGYEGWTVIRNGKKVKATKDEYDADFKLIHDQFKRYQEWSKDNKEPPYLDYWHWLLDHCFYEVSNPSSQYMNITEILKDKKTPSWVKEITQLIYDEFKDELDKDGGLEVWISW
jgi:hypothetical protein